MSRKRQEAAELLLHYLDLAMSGDARNLNPDYRMEIRSIVDLIVDAAIEEIKELRYTPCQT